ncbi:MAG: peptide chain release factor N(5)-glutamine methyltransferase [Lachnospiraceae bacterium]|nr:peptide chain release factor N(5)-glutamine methyltransferase [Lachnospiraceae bacterium]
MNYSGLYRNGTQILSAAGIPEAALDARLLLEFVTGSGTDAVYTHPDDPVYPDEEKKFNEMVAKRADHVPLAYLTGTCGFMGIEFKVNDSVLIPRQDSECLVEEAMIYTGDGDRILDMCTGSGCLLLSLMHYKNGCRGVGVDISEEALSVARDNARMLEEEGGLNGGSVSFLAGDMFEALKDHEGKFDIIIFNPPYIRKDVIDKLMPEVKDHEPRIALDGGPDGLDFYRGIAEAAPDHLAGGGRIFCEIGYDQAEDVAGILADAGFTDIGTVKDYAGNDRVVRARI